MGKFILYDHDKNKGYQYPAITITKNGTINFNIGMLKKFIKDKVYVILYYDREDSRIGFHFFSKNSTKAFKVRKSNKDNLGTISGRPFLNFYNIPYTETNRYQVKEGKNKSCFIINLKENKGYIE